MVNHKDEHVIYIRDMLFAVLYGWRTVLIVAVAAALLLGGCRFVSLRGNDTDSEVIQELQEDYAQQKEALEQEITRLEEQVEVYEDYVVSAPAMAIKPHSVYVTELHFYLESLYTETSSGAENFDPADALLAAYRKLLMSKASLASIAIELDMEGMEMEGIVDVNCDQASNLLTVIVRQAEQKDTVAVPDIVQAAISNAKTTVDEIIGAHKVTMLSSSAALCNDTDLAQFQTRKTDELSSLKETLEARTAEKDALAAPAVGPITNMQVLVSSVKFAILGGLLGFFGVACILVLAHLARKKVYSRRTLEDQTGLSVLGCIPGSKKRSGIDLWLRKLEGRCVEASQQHSLLIAARIRNLCGTEGKLLLSGAGSADDCLRILSALEAVGCTVISKGDLLRDLDAVNALNSCTGVVLLEQCGKSLYTSVGEAAAQAEAIGKPVIGCILIDG